MAQHPLVIESTETEAQETPATGSTQETQASDSQPEEQLPEQYREKSPAELVSILQDKESFIGKQGQELGTYRNLVNELLEAKAEKDRQSITENHEPVKVTQDDLLQGDPTEAITRVVRQELEQALNPVKAQLNENSLLSEQQEFVRDYPTFNETVASQEFQEWINKSPRRQTKGALVAKNEDYGLARELLEDFSEYQELTGVQEKPAPVVAEPGVEAARKVATEGQTRGDVPTGAKVFHQSEVVKLIQSDPEKYRSPSYQAELKKAIAEKRFIT